MMFNLSIMMVSKFDTDGHDRHLRSRSLAAPASADGWCFDMAVEPRTCLINGKHRAVQ